MTDIISIKEGKVLRDFLFDNTFGPKMKICSFEHPEKVYGSGNPWDLSKDLFDDVLDKRIVGYSDEKLCGKHNHDFRIFVA